jgi:hypothetical protein
MNAFTSKLKIVINHYTVVILFEDVYGLPYPENFSRVCSYFRVLEVFPALQMLKLSCAVSYNLHSMLYAGAIATFVLMSIIMLNQYVFRVLRPNHVSALFFVLTFIYPSVSTLTFRTFNCREIDGRWFHREDYSIDCKSNEHLFAEKFAYAAIALVSLGLPVMYMALLYPHRAMLWTGVKATESDVSARNIRFLYSDFQGDFFFWELIDVLRKLIVCGFVVFLEKGSIFRPAVGMMVLLAYTTLVIKLKPYKAAVDNHLAMCASMAQLLSLVGGMLAMVETGFVSVGEYSMGYNSASLSVFLIASFGAVACIGIVFVATDVDSLRRSPLIRDEEGHVVVLKGKEEGSYHLFLCHLVGTGEQQCDAIKRDLKLLVPSMRIFKPSEHTGSIGSQICIANSDNVMIFLSSGIFSSWQPLLEMHKALELDKNVILMRDVVPRHGGGEFVEVFEELDKQQALLDDFADVSAQDGLMQGEWGGAAIGIRERLFGDIDDTKRVILWHRPLFFNRLALKMVVSRILQQQGFAETELSVPGVLSPHDFSATVPPLKPWERFHICLPQHSSSSKKLLKCFQRMNSSRAAPYGRAHSHQLRETMGSWAIGRLSRAAGGLRVGICGDSDGCSLQNSANMVMLLQTSAFRHEPLMDELRQALHLGIHVVKLWERDPTHRMEDFTRFVGTCPKDIRQGKLDGLVEDAEDKVGHLPSTPVGPQVYDIDSPLERLSISSAPLEQIAFRKLQNGLINQAEYEQIVAGDRRRAAVLADEPQSARARIMLHKLAQGLVSQEEYEHIVAADRRRAEVEATEDKATTRPIKKSISSLRRRSGRRTTSCQKIFEGTTVDWFWVPQEFNEASIGAVQKCLQRTTKTKQPEVAEQFKSSRPKSMSTETMEAAEARTRPDNTGTAARIHPSVGGRSTDTPHRISAGSRERSQLVDVGSAETMLPDPAIASALESPALGLKQLTIALEGIGGREQRNSQVIAPHPHSLDTGSGARLRQIDWKELDI